ncbi:hypothetical protein vseg_002811 [Gypsophila vaccaria]
MGKAPCCDKTKVKKGPWTEDEDFKLISHVQKFGHSNWRALPAKAGLLRCGKSCRLRWVNYLSPDVKRGNFTPQEESMIIKLHAEHGNKWSRIASHLPGRTDNEIKNVWNTYLKKRIIIKDDIEKPNLLTNESQNDFNPNVASSPRALPSVSSEVECGNQLEKSPEGPNMCNFVSSSMSQDVMQENLPSSTSSTISNISSLDNTDVQIAEDEFINFDDDLFQTLLDPEFDFWFTLENTN